MYRLRGSTGIKALLLLLLLLFAGKGALAQEKGRLYIVGIGPGASDLITLRGISTIKKAQVIICSEEVESWFTQYLIGKEIITQFFGDKGTKAHKRKLVAGIEERLSQGKDVALLEYGDPCIFGPTMELINHLHTFDITVIPGVSAFNAAGAALKRTMTPEDAKFAMITTAENLLKNDGLLKDLSKYQAIMAVYCGLKKADRLFASLKQHYPPDLPVAVVYYAGYPHKEKVVEGNIENIMEHIRNEKEKHLGLILIGSSN
jgi:precorrin-4 methylase